MSHRARIFLRRPGTKIAVDLGQKDLDVRPIRYGRAQFEHDGKTEVGRIEQIDPPDWENSGTVPKVLVVADGRWAEALIDDQTAATMAPARALGFIEASPWRIVGGSYYGHDGKRVDGEPRTTST